MRYGQLVSDSLSQVWLFHRVVQAGGFDTMFAIPMRSTTPTVLIFLFVRNDYIFLCKPTKILSALRALYNFTIQIPKYYISGTAQLGSWRIQRCCANIPCNGMGWLGSFISPSHHPFDVQAVGTWCRWHGLAPKILLPQMVGDIFWGKSDILDNNLMKLN